MSDAAPDSEKKRKRPRAARACEGCRTKKYKCDELYPCGQCKRQKVECIYKGDENMRQRMNSSRYVEELEKKVQELSSNRASMSQPPPAFLPQNSTPLSSTFMSSAMIHEDVVNNSDDDESGDEVEDVNAHTQNVEFHGKTSSMAFLAALRPPGTKTARADSMSLQNNPDQPSLVSTLHNVAFSPDSITQSNVEESTLEKEQYYFRQSRLFLDAYFENLHFIHPIIEKAAFLSRCEDLWFGRARKQPRSFLGLYCSVMSLGALVRTWDEETIDGMGRFQWSRKLFTHAKLALGELRATNDLETVQCLFFMAKVCQNELNPHLAYMYLGMAVRASLSAGHNRASGGKRPSAASAALSAAISKTWWGLYSLEMETSFALGRPDSLGLDEYHNRPMPALDDTETAMLVAMVTFARVTRKVSISIYLAESSVQERATKASEIERYMDAWLDGLPERIRPQLLRREKEGRITKDPKWARRQRLVLELRYFNVKMVLYRPFLISAAKSPHRMPVVLQTTVLKCVDAARKTIEVMHETFCNHVFFRTWWYNTTYTLYAASIILCYASQVAPNSERPPLFDLINKTLEVLDSMDESVVAKKAAEMIRQSLNHAQETPGVSYNKSRQDHTPTHQNQRHPSITTSELSIDALLDMQMPSTQIDPEFDFINATFPLDESQFLLWSDMSGQFGGFPA